VAVVAHGTAGEHYGPSCDARTGLPRCGNSPDAVWQISKGERGGARFIVKLQTLSEQFPLPWSHYVRVLAVEDPQARKFYEAEALRGGWTVKQRGRQIGSMFYERTALSHNNAAMLTKHMPTTGRKSRSLLRGSIGVNPEYLRGATQKATPKTTQETGQGTTQEGIVALLRATPPLTRRKLAR
jgi:hypothetical protein